MTGKTAGLELTHRFEPVRAGVSGWMGTEGCDTERRAAEFCLAAAAAAAAAGMLVPGKGKGQLL